MKKLATILALTGIILNLGIATVFAQETAEGTQTLGCPTSATTAFANTPLDFTIGTGSRNILSSNDTSFVEATNGAYFGALPSPTDTMQITSDTPSECGAASNGVILTVGATPFENAGSVLLTNGSYYASYSVVTDGTVTQTGYTGATGTVETIADLEGETNYFNGVTGETLNVASGASTALLTAVATGTANAAIQLYDNSLGYNGQVDLEVDYALFLPGNLTEAGTYTSTVTYTLSAS